MWIEEIFIESFGRAQQVAIRDLVPGVTVIVGSNEAGKSTVLEFVRSVLFGFKRSVAKTNIYESVSGNPRGGWITMGNGDGTSYRVHRVEKRGVREGSVTVSDNAGRPVDPTALSLLGTSLERSAYENLFAFDLDGMRRLDRDALRGKIVGAALGSVAVNPLDVMKTVNDRLKRIARCPLRDGESLWSLQNRLKEVDKQIRATADAPERHSRLTVELQRVDTLRDRTTEEIGRRETALGQLNGLLRYEEEWKRLTEIDREITSLESARDFPADGLLRLERAMERRDEAREALRETEKILSRLCEQLDLLEPDNPVLAYSEELNALNRDAARLSGRPIQVQKARGALSKAEALLDEEISNMGPGWNRERLAAFEPSLVLEQEIREYIEMWRACHETSRQLSARHQESTERCRSLRSKTLRIKSELSQTVSLCRGFLPRESQRRLDQWKSHRHRISDLTDSLHEKSRRFDHLSGLRGQIEGAMETAAKESSRFISPVLFWAIVILLASATGGMFYTGWRSSDASSYLFYLTATCLLLCIPFGIRWRLDRERRYEERKRRETDSLGARQSAVTREMALTEKSGRAIRSQIEELRKESEQIAEEVLGNRQAGRAVILMAESLSAKAEEPMERRRMLEADLRTAYQDLAIEDDRTKEISHQILEADTKFSHVKESWNRLACERGLFGGMGPETALGLLARLSETKRRLRQYLDDEEDLRSMEREWDSFVQRVQAFGRKVGDSEPVGQSALDRVDHWMRIERRAREVLTERASLRERIRDNEAAKETWQNKLNEVQDVIDGLMNAAGVSDEESFRERAQNHERFNERENERRGLLAALLSGMDARDESDLRSLMAEQDWHGNHEAAAALQTALNDSRSELEQLANRSGKLSREIEFLESEDKTERLQAEKQELLTRLNRFVEEWMTLKCGSLILEKTMRMYETDRQPMVLAKGSEIFRTITGSAFSRILFPLDEDRVRAERADRTRVEEHHLSRGTLEQIYLALRLAHVELLSQGDPIPVMVDDILVNFDPARARRTARALTDFSDRTDTQVLFFTCHPHTADLFPATVTRRVLEAFPNHASHREATGGLNISR